MPKIRKKPVEVSTDGQWFKDGDIPGVREHDTANKNIAGYNGTAMCWECGNEMYKHGWVATLEGGHTVCPGDWIITGVKGEKYPCKPDIFKQTYEFVEEA